MSETKAQIRVDLRADSHQGFHDHDWGEKLLDRTRATALQGHAFVLCERWKSTSNAFRMPWLLLQTLNSFQDGVFRQNSTPAESLIQALADSLGNDPILALRRMQSQNLVKRLRELHGRITEVLRSNPPPFDRQAIWEDFIRHHEFAMGTAAVCEMSHNNLLFAYEHYCESCMEAVPPVGAEKPGAKFPERFIARYGQVIFDEVHGPEIKIARQVRNTFAHTSGRVDEKLRKAGVDLPLGEKVPVTPDLVRSLYAALTKGADTITDESFKILNRGTSP